MFPYLLARDLLGKDRLKIEDCPNNKPLPLPHLTEADMPASGGRTRNLLRAALVLLSSAALGGLALAIWNRKGIGSMHKTTETSQADSAQP